jgi:DNA invertase Pin-like site-specific DNA recombinase
MSANPPRRHGGRSMRVGLYARVSTMHNQNPAMQLAELREHPTRRGWEVVSEYIDRGITGARERRPELDRLWADCRKRKVDAVLVYRYDRFARSLRQLVNALEEFRALGIDFISLHEGVDTSTPNGRLVFGIFASIAEFERELIRGRVISGLAAAVARGVRLGRPKRTVDAAEIARLRASGASWREVAERMGIGVGTAVRALQQALQIPQEITPSKLPTNN